MLLFLLLFLYYVFVLASSLVFKMSHSCKYHRDAEFVAGFDGVFVADGAARLDDGGDAVLMGHLDNIIKWEEGV